MEPSTLYQVALFSLGADCWPSPLARREPELPYFLNPSLPCFKILPCISIINQTLKLEKRKGEDNTLSVGNEKQQRFFYKYRLAKRHYQKRQQTMNPFEKSLRKSAAGRQEIAFVVTWHSGQP